LPLKYYAYAVVHKPQDLHFITYCEQQSTASQTQWHNSFPGRE